jgi:type I restriction-modification system DNA methylase subunit
MALPYSVDSLNQILGLLGWSTDEHGEDLDTFQKPVCDSKGNKGILLLINEMPGVFIADTSNPIDDPEDIYKSLLLGWNLEAWFTGILNKQNLFRFYNTTYRPKKESILRSQEKSVLELKLEDVLNIDRVQSRTGKLLLLSPDTWRSKSYKDFLKSPTGRQRLTVDTSLLRDLREWRLTLVRDLRESYENNDLAELEESTQKILDQIIFIRFCEDRKLTNTVDARTLYDLAIGNRGDNFIDVVKELFNYYRHLLNSSLFNENVLEKFQPHPSVLQSIIAESVEFYKFEILDVELLGRIYEEYLSYELRSDSEELFFEFQLEKRKAEGIYYTPAFIVEYIVNRTFEIFSKENARHPQFVLDPACGSGNFLIAVFKAMMKQTYGISFDEKRRLLQESIYGIDLDDRAIERASQALFYILLTGEARLNGTQILPNIVHSNLQVEDSILNRSCFFVDLKFDVIVGNPPYRRINREKLEFYRQQYADLIYNNSDLCWLMLIASIDNLAEGGVVGFIVPDNLLRTNEYTLMRKYILDTTKIIEIDYLNYRAFESSSLQSIILILQKESKAYLRINNQILVNYYFTPGVFERGNSTTIKQETFDNTKLGYSFNVQLTEPAINLFKKIQNQSISVSELFEVSQGIKPDREYLHKFPLNDNCKKYLFGKDIKPYSIVWSGTYIDYEATKVSQNSNVRPRSARLFEIPFKILIRQIVDERLIVALDSENYYIDSTVFVLVPKMEISKEKLCLILAVLTSKLAKFCSQVENPDNKQAFPKIRGRDIEKLPLPAMMNSNLSHGILNCITEVSKNLFKKIEEGINDRQKIYSSPEINRIDELLGELYSLSIEEISLLTSFSERT